MMKSLAVVLLLVVGAYSQRPQPCNCPSQWEGGMLEFIQSKEMQIQGEFSYDAVFERTRISMMIDQKKHKSSLEVIMLYQEKKMYLIHNETASCTVQKFDEPFKEVFNIPKNATFITEQYVGSGGVSEGGVLLYTFAGETAAAQYIATVTAERCLPVNFLLQTKQFGSVYVSFYDIVLGIRHPERFVPPPICDGKEPVGVSKPPFSFNFF